MQNWIPLLGLCISKYQIEQEGRGIIGQPDVSVACKVAYFVSAAMTLTWLQLAILWIDVSHWCSRTCGNVLPLPPVKVLQCFYVFYFPWVNRSFFDTAKGIQTISEFGVERFVWLLNSFRLMIINPLRIVDFDPMMYHEFHIRKKAIRACGNLLLNRSLFNWRSKFFSFKIWHTSMMNITGKKHYTPSVVHCR